LAEEEAEARVEAAQQKQAKKKKEVAAQAKAAKAATEKASARKAAAVKKRAQVFKAARDGKFDLVKKGVWEDEIDAAGPESEASVEKETLLHLVAKKGNTELVSWLLDHGLLSSLLLGETR